MDDKQPIDIQSDEIFDPMQYLGNILTTAKDEYEILEYLGEGLTAVVFKARQISTGSHCALKLLRPTASSLSKLNFWEELNIIRKLRSNGLQSVPNVLDYQKDQTPEFLVLDLISPEEYPGLHQILKGRPYLSEEEALAIFSEALALLDKLHTTEQRTYIDMQLKNFCWNSSERRLIVMDWNHVSYSKEVIEAELQKESNQRNVDVLQQLRGRGARDFDDLVQLDLRRLTTYFYTLLTGKAANELGETVWGLENRASDVWGTVSVPSRQIVLRVLTPRGGRDKLNSAAKILAEVSFARELLATNDIDELQNKFDEAFDRAKNTGTQEQPDEIYRAVAYVDRIEKINDPRFGRWVKSQRSLLKEIEDFESTDWHKGKNFYKVGSFDEARRYWDQEAEALGKVQLWRWTLLARICADVCSALSEERQRSLTQKLESAIESLQQGDIQKANADFQYTQELTSHEVIGWWQEEIQALALLDTLEPGLLSNKPGDAANILAEVTNLSFWEGLPYTPILLRDDVWYVAVQKILSLSQVEELRSHETVNLQEILQNLVQELRLKQQEISISSDLLESFLSLDLESFKGELKKALYKTPNHPEVVRSALDYMKNRNTEEQLEIIDILSDWAWLDEGLRVEIMAYHRALYQAVFNKLLQRARQAEEDQNLYLALVYVNKSRAALKMLQELGEDEKLGQNEMNKLNAEIGTAAEMERGRLDRAQELQLSWKIEGLVKKIMTSVDDLIAPWSKLWSAGMDDLVEVNAILGDVKQDLNRLQAQIERVPENGRGDYSARYKDLSTAYECLEELSQHPDLKDFKHYFTVANTKFDSVRQKRGDAAELRDVKEDLGRARQIMNRWILTYHAKKVG